MDKLRMPDAQRNEFSQYKLVVFSLCYVVIVFYLLKFFTGFNSHEQHLSGELLGMNLYHSAREVSAFNINS